MDVSVQRQAYRLICERLWSEGHRVYASMRDPSGADPAFAARCTPVTLDVIDDSSVTAAVDLVIGEEGRIDAVVNNAGYALWGPIEETPGEAVEREFNVNVFGPLRVIRAAVPHMRRQGSGVIVQMSSISGRVVAGPFWRHYAASKFALEAHSEALAYELRPFGVRVVLIEPGSYATTIGDSIEFTPGLREGSSAYERAYRAMAEVEEPWPLGDPDEVASAVADAVRESDTPLRILLGEDAEWYMTTRAEGDDYYREELWRLWRLPGA